MDLRTASGEIGQWRGMKVIAVKESNFSIEKAKENTIYALTNGSSNLKMVRVRSNVANRLGTIDKDGNVSEFDAPMVYKVSSKPVERKKEENKPEYKVDKCEVVECTEVDIDMDYIRRLMNPIDEYINKMLEKSYEV